MSNTHEIFNALHPARQITLSGAASAAMASQGQFQAFDDATPIIDVTTAALGAGEIRVRLKPAGIHGGVDRTSLVKFFVNAASGNVEAAINGGLGTVRYLSNATGDAFVVVEPNATTGKIDLTITLTAGAGTAAVVWAEHRGYCSKPESITSAT